METTPKAPDVASGNGADAAPQKKLDPLLEVLRAELLAVMAGDITPQMLHQLSRLARAGLNLLSARAGRAVRVAPGLLFNQDQVLGDDSVDELLENPVSIGPPVPAFSTAPGLTLTPAAGGGEENFAAKIMRNIGQNFLKTLVDANRSPAQWVQALAEARKHPDLLGDVIKDLEERLGIGQVAVNVALPKETVVQIGEAALAGEFDDPPPSGILDDKSDPPPPRAA